MAVTLFVTQFTHVSRHFKVLNVDKRWEGGESSHVDKKKILIVNIINFLNVDKPRGGSDNVDTFFVVVEFGNFFYVFLAI